MINYGELEAAGTMAAARKKGSLRVEGREYLMVDGDIILVRFNV